MTATSRRSGGGAVDPGTIVLWAVLVVVIVGVRAVTGAVHLGHRLAGASFLAPGNPFELVIGLATGNVAWPGPATAVLIGVGVLVSCASSDCHV